MQKQLSDTQIRANLRSLLTETGFDPNKTNFICTRGVVRLRGDLISIHDSPVHPRQVDELEHSLRRTRGVVRVHFHLRNWERLPTGVWRLIEKVRRRAYGAVDQGRGEETERLAQVEDSDDADV